MRHSILNGSHRKPLKGHTKGKEVAGNKVLKASLQTPMVASLKTVLSVIQQVQTGVRAPLSTAEIIKLTGSNPADVRKVHSAVSKNGITIMPSSDADLAHGIIRIKGTYARFKHFSPGLVLNEYRDKKGNKVIAREGELSVEAGLPISGFFGLDRREVAHTHYRLRKGKGKGKARPRTIPTGLTSRGLATLQGWKVEEMDTYVRVTAYITLGGDNVKIGNDLKTTAKKEGIKAAAFSRVSTDGSANGKYTDDATVENTLDLHAQALLNPNGAVVALAAGNTDDDFAGAAEFAVTFKGVTINGKVIKLEVVTISWGMAESGNTADSLQRWARIGLSSQLAGIDFIAATGDNGPNDSTDAATPDAPSSVPWIGGAAGVGINAPAGTITDIHTWNDTASGGGETGYGISATFPPMAEEARLNLPVSATTGKAGHSASVFADLAAPDSGPTLLYNNQEIQVGGTSHSAPFQGAKAAYLKTKFGFSSFLALAYASGEKMVDQITTADDSAPYPATTDALYNVMTGFGVLDYDKSNAVAATAQKKAA
ncbi:MAG TPA: hypothetical protein V6C81_21545 [Planktothrix sp.]|jgi:hypothetical protein